MIRQYNDKKTNKKMWEIKNEYIGKNIFTGKEKRLNKKGFITKREAVNHVTKIKNEFTENGCIDNSKYKFKDVYELFNEQYKLQVKESTFYCHEKTFKNILPIFGKLKIKEIKLPFCQKYLNDISKTYKRDYVKQIKAKISMIFDYAVKMELITTNYMRLAKVPKKQEEKKENYYTKSELLEFLEIVKNNYSHEIYLAFRLLAFTGIRKGELASLTWKDFNFKDKTLTINKNTIYTNSKIKVSTTKTTSSNRVIFLDNETSNLFFNYRKQQGLLSLDNSIFIKNMYWIDNNLKAIYKKFPNLKKITLHGFRHTHATLLFESGLTIKDISERLGHSDISTTLNIYTHLTEDRKKDITDKFIKYLSM